MERGPINPTWPSPRLYRITIDSLTSNDRTAFWRTNNQNQRQASRQNNVISNEEKENWEREIDSGEQRSDNLNILNNLGEVYPLL